MLALGPKCKCLQVHVVGTQIDVLKSSISNLRASMLAYGIQPVNEGERRRTGVSIPKWTFDRFKEDFVGREDSIGELEKELLNDGKNNRVIFIWGMGGLGKTSVAKKVIAYDKVRNNFDCFACVCISQEYRVKDILIEILFKLIPDQREKVKDMIEYELFKILYEIQQEKRCIVLLDDIWTKEAWDSLCAAFPIKDTRSKLLITTRNKEVAEYIDPQGLLHELRCLSDQESWDLLNKRVFPETNAARLSSTRLGVGHVIATDPPVEGFARQVETGDRIPVITKDMKRLGDELLKKCGGLPLAIIVLGGLLAVNEWETVYKKFNMYFGHESDVSKVLALSYDDLPWYLKPCFLYLGGFPEDAEISVTKVLYMWIAEGFVLPSAYDEERGVTVEYLAEQYMMELINRGMVHVRLNLSGKIKTCRFHDLIRDLCISKATQESFLSILNVQPDNGMAYRYSSITTEVESTCKTRRLSLHLGLSAERNTIVRVKQPGSPIIRLRTLMFFGFTHGISPIFIKCMFLRVLKLEDVTWIRDNLHESVGDLIHLRYLGLAGSSFWGLPQSMEHLVCMEFLDLHVKNYNVTMPNVLWKMRRLRYLHLPLYFSIKGKFYRRREKLRMDTLKDLRTLRNFCPDKCDVEDIGKMANLQRLTVIGLDDLEIISQVAELALEHLRCTSFRFSSSDQLFSEGGLSIMSSYRYSCKLFIKGKIEKLPEQRNLAQQLRRLVLLGSLLEEDPMPILEKLQHLLVLILGYEAYAGKEMICSAGGFLQLMHLVLHWLPNLEEWRIEEGAMPHLSRLGISECPNLKTLPEGVHTYDCHQEVFEEYMLRSQRERR